LVAEVTVSLVDGPDISSTTGFEGARRRVFVVLVATMVVEDAVSDVDAVDVRAVDGIVETTIGFVISVLQVVAVVVVVVVVVVVTVVVVSGALLVVVVVVVTVVVTLVVFTPVTLAVVLVVITGTRDGGCSVGDTIEPKWSTQSVVETRLVLVAERLRPLTLCGGSWKETR
jgi:hypothetical protein